MTERAEFTSFFLQVAASPSPMRKAIVEACDAFMEGMGPSFTELRHYLNEINLEDEPSPEFSEAWDMSGEHGTPAGVVHFLTSELPEGRKAFTEILRLAQGKELPFVDMNQDVEDEVGRLTDKDMLYLRDAELTNDFTPGTVRKVLELVPACALAVLRQTIGDWSSSDERNLAVPDDPGDGMVVNGWLVHNTDHAEQIYDEGFLIGNPIGYLAYGKHDNGPDGKYGFAYRIQDAPEPRKSTAGPGLKYTSTDSGASIVFQGTGNVVDHYGDREKQVIFDIHEPKGCFLVAYTGDLETWKDYNIPEWAVYGKDPDNPLVSGKTYRECLDWIETNGYQYRNQMKRWDNDMTLQECMHGIEGTPLEEALTAGYMTLLEGGTVNNELKELYNFLVSTGDWEQVSSTGKHAVRLAIKIDPAIRGYANENLNPREDKNVTALVGSIPFSGTNNSDSHAKKNAIHDIRAAYRLACQCEYEVKGHDTSSMVWPEKAQQFSDKYCHGSPVWIPPEDSPAPAGEEDNSQSTMTVDGQTFECPWIYYADKNKKKKKQWIVSSVTKSGEPIMEGKLGRLLGGAALGLGLMAGGAHAGSNVDPMACLASPTYAKSHSEYCNTLKPDPKEVAKIKAEKAKQQKLQTQKKAAAGKTATTKSATLKHVYGNKDYNERVNEIITQMLSENPDMDHSRIVRRAEQQAIDEIVADNQKKKR